MSWKWLRFRTSVRRVRWPLALMVLWFVAGFFLFRSVDRLEWLDSLLSTFYLQVQSDALGQGYAFWGQIIVFGLLFGIILKESLENYIERCRDMAGLLKDHTIIVGYSNLGRLLVQHCIERKHPYAVIEKDKELVDDLMRRGEPVVVDDARSDDALPAANIQKAKTLIVASNNIETALIVTKKARDANPGLKIAVRCHHDEFVDVLKKLGADDVYSTSAITYRELSSHLPV